MLLLPLKYPAILLILVVISASISEATHNVSEIKSTTQVYLYRLLNWCIVGKGEYRLHEWPLSQFKFVLDRNFKNEQEWALSNKERLTPYTGGKDPWEDYELTFSGITCSKMPKGYGVNGHFLNRLHVQFKPKAPTAQPFQGLMIQGVHSTFGLGFPFGAFDTDDEFTCKDTCQFFEFSRIVGCISRPDIAPMHSTVAMYHFKLRNDTNEEYDYQKELHWNYKWANLPCTSARLVEFWVLMVIDFDTVAFTVKKFGPYDFNVNKEPFTKLEEPHKFLSPHIGADDNIIQPALPTPIIPECYPLPAPITIGDRGRPRVCFRQFIPYDPKECMSWEEKTRNDALAQPPPPHPPGSPTAPPLEPNEMECHGPDVIPEDATSKTRVRFEGEFDVQCTRRYPGTIFQKIYGKTKRQPHKICPEWQGRYQCQGSSDAAGDLHYDSQVENAGPGGDRSFPFSHCDPCKRVTEEATTLPSTELPLFKRTEHGILMIYAFFFFNPVSLNVARFYKETLHERHVKGWRIWLVIHVGFAAMASVIAYIGYTFPSFKEIDAHIALGYGALVGISSGIITGWFRHKMQILQVMMFYIHALSGYLGWALAIASMAFAPGISRWTRLISYIASAICLAAMGIMTMHICSVDSKLGIRPKRSHIPIIEIRFDDIIPPNSRFRKVFLYLYILIQFAICFGMLVL